MLSFSFEFISMAGILRYFYAAFLQTRCDLTEVPVEGEEAPAAVEGEEKTEEELAAELATRSSSAAWKDPLVARINRRKCLAISVI